MPRALREIVPRAQLVGELAHQPQQLRRQIAIDGHGDRRHWANFQAEFAPSTVKDQCFDRAHGATTAPSTSFERGTSIAVASRMTTSASQPASASRSCVVAQRFGTVHGAPKAKHVVRRERTAECRVAGVGHWVGGTEVPCSPAREALIVYKILSLRKTSASSSPRCSASLDCSRPKFCRALGARPPAPPLAGQRPRRRHRRTRGRDLGGSHSVAEAPQHVLARRVTEGRARRQRTCCLPGRRMHRQPLLPSRPPGAFMVQWPCARYSSGSIHGPCAGRVAI